MELFLIALGTCWSQNGLAEMSAEDKFNLSIFFDSFYKENFDKNFFDLA